MGSCFTENIGNKLDYYLFNTTLNPFGILYNPNSIAICLEKLIQNTKFEEKDLCFSNNLYFSFFHHSRFSAETKEACLSDINSSIKSGATALKGASHLIITFGTSWAYKHLEKDCIISNCHKQPSSLFERQFINSEDIYIHWNELIKNIKKSNPQLKIIFTISPIRHIKDGLTQNSLSKANLITAVHKIIANNKDTFYFPSFEIMMDDLRDYRFYDDDFVHPNQLAVDYIWECFQKTWIDNSSISLFKTIDQFQKAISHRAFFSETPSHQSFLKKTLNKVKVFQKEYPQISINRIIKILEEKITT
ncbi:MAG: GSCFA domain-containing protein [Bacteroidales bacterium]